MFVTSYIGTNNRYSIITHLIESEFCDSLSVIPFTAAFCCSNHQLITHSFSHTAQIIRIIYGRYAYILVTGFNPIFVHHRGIYTSTCVCARALTQSSIGSFGTVTRLRALWPESRRSAPGKDKRFFFLARHPDRLWSPQSLLLKGYCGSFQGGIAAGREVSNLPRSRNEDWEYMEKFLRSTISRLGVA